MRICVTGHRGYVGSAFVDFAQRCHRPRPHCGKRRPIQWKLVDLAAGQDLLRAATIHEIRDFAPDILYNFAGSSGERQCEGDPDAWDLNALVPLRLLNIVQPKILVQASSCSLYGLGSLYTESKAYAEKCFAINENETATIAFRFGTVFGANEASMRWDLPMHKMIRDAVVDKLITVPEKVLMRPWLDLDTLCKVLWRVAVDFAENCVVPKGYHCVPLVSENLSLQNIAVQIIHEVGPTEIDWQPPADTRDYTAPSVIGDCGITGVAISDIAALLEDV